MTSTPPAATRRWRAVLLAALTVLAALLLGSVSASAATVPAAETRVRALTPAAVDVVEIAQHIAAGQHQCRAPSQPQLASGRCVAAEGTAIAIRPPLSISSKQFGTKWGRHAADYGLNPGDSAARSWFMGRARSVHLNPDEVRQGAWRGGGENYFFRQGEDLLITQPDGTFVTMFPGASTDGWFESAEVFPH